MSDYTEAEKLGLLRDDRWEEGIDHHPMSERIGKFLYAQDTYGMWDFGGDGDNGVNGEELLYQLDPFFELLDLKAK